MPSPTESKTVPLEVFRQNIQQILDLLTSPSSPYAVAHGSHPLSIILITPPAIHDDMLGDTPAVSNEHTKLYRDAVLQIGAEWQKKQQGERWKLGTIDFFGALATARQTGDSTRFYT